MDLVWQFVFIFSITTAVDWMWGKYIIHTAEKRPLKSALYASILTASSAYITIAYVSDHRLIAPAIFGAFFGTYLTVKMSS